jgi:FkbM family methyltransferase
MHYWLAKVLHKLKLLEKVNTTVARSINGKTIQVPLIGGVGYDHLNVYEQWMSEILGRVISFRKGAFVDVGVNLGQTLVKLRGIDPAMDYTGFEPNPKCIYYCNALIEANGFKNCKVVPVGLFNKDSLLELNLYAEGGTDAAASVIENFRPNDKIYQKHFVPVKHFENIKQIVGINVIAIVKIDVEGAELEVLESLEESIRLHRPILLVEILCCYSALNESRIKRQESIEALLKRLNYSIIRIHKRNGLTIERLELLQSIGIHDNIEWCDYVITPSEMTDRLLF